MRPKPSRVSAFRNCFGTIWSVSTLTRSSGATIPVCVVNGCILCSSVPFVWSSHPLVQINGIVVMDHEPPDLDRQADGHQEAGRTSCIRKWRRNGEILGRLQQDPEDKEESPSQEFLP